MHLTLNSPTRFWTLAGALLAQGLVATCGFCVSVVVPNDLFNMGGNSFSSLPFDTGANTVRYQQVFDASQFGPVGPLPGIGPGGAWITMLSFRVASSGQNFNTTLPSIRIDLSTTSKAPDALSPTFSANVGADDAIVFGTGPLSIRAGGFVGPGAWDIAIPLAHPFFYLPSSGNLLMDVRNFGGGNTTFFDGQMTLGDSVSVVVSWSAVGGSVDSPSGTTGTFGLATLFEVTPVPEPAAIPLMLLGFCALALIGWRRKAAQRS